MIRCWSVFRPVVAISRKCSRILDNAEKDSGSLKVRAQPRREFRGSWLSSIKEKIVTTQDFAQVWQWAGVCGPLQPCIVMSPTAECITGMDKLSVHIFANPLPPSHHSDVFVRHVEDCKPPWFGVYSKWPGFFIGPLESFRLAYKTSLPTEMGHLEKNPFYSY